MATINKRVENLENNAPATSEHDYEMYLHWEEEAEYFKDGKPISRAQYFREAPKETGKINISWVEVNPEEEDDENDKNTG